MSADLLVDATLDKAYPGCVVLRGATLQVRPGTVHALVGENGAGKSTLVKILAGVLRADAGQLSFALDVGRVDLARWDRMRARAAGIGIVQQHGSFAETLSVVENTVLGVEGGPLLSLAGPSAALSALGAKIGLAVDPSAAAGELSPGAAQRAEIVSALADPARLHEGEAHHMGAAKLLVLDEPTAVLTPVEVAGLLTTLRALAAQGTAIIIVTHKLDEVRDVADDVTVLRAGKTVATFSTRDAPLDPHAIARAMVGADLPKPSAVPAPGTKVVLALRDVAAGVLDGVTLSVHAGELVGIAGVDGNGQSELARAVAGLEPLARGTIDLAGASVTRASPAARLAAGLAHIPEDRHHGGLLLEATIAENLSLGRRDITGRFRLDRSRIAEHARTSIADLDIRPPDPAVLASALSGGNQQKIVVARELSRPRIAAVVASQPTRGVDLGAVAKIHDRLRAAARSGAGVLVISADLDELLALCHRIIVVLRGKIVGELAGDALRADGAREQIGELMTGAGGT